MALADVGAKRMAAYKVLSMLFLEKADISKEKPLQKQMKLFLTIFNKFMYEVPADHFTVDLKSGEIKSLK